MKAGPIVPVMDLIDSAGYGYRKVWDERQYLLKIALIPFIIKFACTVLVFVFDQQTAFLRQGLMMVPALFAEGWVLAQFLRTIIMHERWPVSIPEKDMLKVESMMPDSMDILAPYLERARSIMASVISFVLLGMAGFVFFAVILSLVEMSGGVPHVDTGDNDAVKDIMFLPALLMIVASLWAFRFMWLFVPMVVLMPVTEFLKRLGGFMVSVRMFAVWLVCFTPIMFLVLIVRSYLLSPYGGDIATSPSFITFGIVFMNSFAEMLVSVISATAIAYGIKDILSLKHPKAFQEYQGV